MNQSFFQMPEARRNAILQAAYQVFSQNTYREANMNDIAARADISKSLLFYYFRNKRELYLYLWNEAARLTYESLIRSDVYAADSLFDMMDQGLVIKADLMAAFPDMALFALRAFLEKDPEVQDAVQASYASWFSKQVIEAINQSDRSLLRQDVDLDMMMEQIRLASEGYMYQMEKEGLNTSQLLADSRSMMKFWKQIYSIDKGDSNDTDS